jgi:hypothetical protein
MNAPTVIIPPRKGSGGRSIEVHGAIYIAFVIDGLDGERTAARVNEIHKTFETRNSINSYANRQGWIKHTSPGPRPKPPKPQRAMRPPSPARVRPVREAPPAALPRAPAMPLKPRPVYEPDFEAPDPDVEAEVEVRYRARVHPANPRSRRLAELEPLDPITGKHELACKFPVGDDCPDHMADHLFCGRPRLEGELYCEPHARVAFKSPAAEKKVRPHDTTPSPRRNAR